jgi:hypothetical protein
MKKILAIIIVIFGNSAYFCHSQTKEVETSPFKTVQIITPGRFYHDDGSDLIKYPKYKIRDTTGSLIIVVPESINRHHTIAIPTGKYLLELHKPGNRKTYRLNVSDESFQRFLTPYSIQDSNP